MYTTRVSIAEIQDKKLLKGLKPFCIPIGIICYKSTASYRKPIYRRTTLIFDVVDRKVYMNGIEVDVTLNADGQFVIAKNFIEGYAVRKSDTLEFFEFLETNDIPYIGVVPEENELWRNM